MPETRWAAAAVVLFAAGGAAQLAGAPAPVWWGLYLACCAAGGWGPGWAGVQALRERSLDVDLLMVVAAVAAAAIGQVFDGALLIVIFATSGALEAAATRRTSDSVRALLDLAPEQATRLTPDGEQKVDAADLVVGDEVLVRPGELIGADGHVVHGHSEVDQSSITGEALPVAVRDGDEVFAGTLNGTGALRVRVARAAADTVVARIVTQVEQASATTARTQLFVERVERRYSVVVVVVTVALIVVPLVWGAAFEPTLLRAMTFMIVASPCAVVLATMPPLLSAIATTGRHGVLVKSAVVMEKLARPTLVAFDKTGTLTAGTPHLVGLAPTPAGGWDDDELLRAAAAAEQPSQHPLARAVLTAAADRGLALPAAEQFGSTPGRGVHAVIDGRPVRVSAPAALADLPTAGDRRASRRDSRRDDHREVGERNQAAVGQARSLVRGFEQQGHTAVVVLVEQTPVGVLALGDRLRGDAADTVAAVTALTGNSPVLLTGDNPRAAHALAARVGITDVRAGLLPEQKVDAVRALHEAGHHVLVVGDGVNDAPALATADLGVAMGRHGSDLALETADAVLVRDELATLPATITLARRAHQIVRANLVIAATVIIVLVAWDLVATLPLPLGVAGHETSTVIVGLNGLRLLTRRAWRTTHPGTTPPR